MWPVALEMAGLMEPRPILEKVYCLALVALASSKQNEQINKKILAPSYRFLI